MRISSVEAIPAGNSCYPRVVGDDGTSGVGESTFFGWPTAVSEIVRSIGEYLQGRDAFDVEHHWLALYRALSFRGMAVTSAISAVDQALWDLKGKHFEVPVWQLLGGRARRAVRAMKVLEGGSTETLVEEARHAVDDEGYGALKILLFQNEHHLMRQAARIDDLVARFAAVRETVGWHIDLGVELHRNMTSGDAVLLSGELTRFRPLFVEDPIPPDSIAALRAFAAKVALPVRGRRAQHDNMGVRRLPGTTRHCLCPTRRRDRRWHHPCEEDLCAGGVVPRRNPPPRGSLRSGRGGCRRAVGYVRTELGAPGAPTPERPSVVGRRGSCDRGPRRVPARPRSSGDRDRAQRRRPRPAPAAFRRPLPHCLA